MTIYFKIALVYLFYSLVNPLYALAPISQRIPQFSNDNVVVWETIIYPTSRQGLKMHRHAHDRVVVALSNGTLKITNNKGAVHYLKLKKDTSYYLGKDTPKELHTDENIGNHPIKVIVIELKN